MQPEPDEILLEITIMGGSQRVAALDPRSLIEVVFQAPLQADRRSIELLARQKLAFRQARERAAATAPRGRGGTIA